MFITVHCHSLQELADQRLPFCVRAMCQLAQRLRSAQLVRVKVAHALQPLGFLFSNSPAAVSERRHVHTQVESVLQGLAMCSNTRW